MKKNTNNIIAVLILLIGVSTLLIFYFFSYSRGSSENKYFVSDKKTEAMQLYDEVMALSPENYPQTPEEVADMYFKAYRLLYGNMIKDDRIITDILRSQRQLLSAKIQQTNSLEQQEEVLRVNLENYKEQGFYITNITTKPAVYTKNNNSKAYVRVMMEGNDFSDYYWNYYLERDSSGFFRIIGWKNTDENYKEIS